MTKHLHLVPSPYRVILNGLLVVTLGSYSVPSVPTVRRKPQTHATARTARSVGGANARNVAKSSGQTSC